MSAPNQPPELTEDQARESAYRPITTSYSDNERHWLRNVLADMRRGSIDHVIVHQHDGPEVWRRGVRIGDGTGKKGERYDA